MNPNLGPYVRHIADLMGLRDWTIVIDADPCEDPLHVAECAVVVGRRVAHLAFAADFTDRPLDEQRNAVVHELVHVYLDQTKVAANLVTDCLGSDAHTIFQAAHQQAIEFGADGLAGVIAPHMPLPTRRRSRQ